MPAINEIWFISTLIAANRDSCGRKRVLVAESYKPAVRFLLQPLLWIDSEVSPVSGLESLLQQAELVFSGRSLLCKFSEVPAQDQNELGDGIPKRRPTVRGRVLGVLLLGVSLSRYRTGILTSVRLDVEGLFRISVRAGRPNRGMKFRNRFDRFHTKINTYS